MVANSTAEEVIAEKRIEVAMRMIGHQVLMCLGDDESRILPIEKVDQHYKISFEVEFGFDPADIVSIIDRVMTETRIATRSFVEVEQCETKEVVHSFEIGNNLIPCEGRIIPEDCYSLLVTILDGSSPIANLQTTTADDSSFIASWTKIFTSPFLMVSLLILIGFMAYFFKKKNPADIDPNLIMIGAYQFDKRNMALSIDNKSVELSNKEAELLSLLHTSANAPIEREVILQRVWGDEGDYVGRTLDVFISKLRKKLEADASVKIVNIRGIGYKLVMDVPR
ncbi:MAG: hypothetical protein DHS20C18_35710 [Saprospiraceae bacterium]|nr:MAG: hypothetical protein DHS20C18_35710 [Saprospiraceae bacterium]